MNPRKSLQADVIRVAEDFGNILAESEHSFAYIQVRQAQLQHRVYRNMAKTKLTRLGIRYAVRSRS